MPLVSELLRREVRGDRPSESEIWTNCATCGSQVHLSEAFVDRGDPFETTYHCPHGCGPILVVSLPGPILWEEGGWRAGDWVVRNASDLYWQPIGKDRLLLLRARIHAID